MRLRFAAAAAARLLPLLLLNADAAVIGSFLIKN